MGVKRFILLFISVVYACCTHAQIEGEYVQSRILILLDESSSMIEPWVSGKPKYKAAHEIIMKLMDSVYAVNNQVEFGLRVFGHQHTVQENDCYDTKNEVPFSQDNKMQMYLRLEDIHPLGVTPIAFALEEAANKDLVDEEHNAYSIVLITDGGESCGGDICKVVQTLLNSKVYFKPYIVSLENDPTLRTTYSCLGSFLQVTNEADIPSAVKTIVDAFRPAIKLTRKDYETIAANVPSVLKMDAPPKILKVPEAEALPYIPAADPKLFTIKVPVQERVIARLYDTRLPPAVKEQPVLPSPEAIADLPPAHVKIATVKVAPPAPAKVKPIALNVKLPPVVIDTPVLPKQETIARLKTAPLRQFNVIFVIEEHNYPTRPVPPMPPFVKEKQVVAEAPKPQPTPKPVADDKAPEIKVERTDADQTTLEVYLTNGAGKFYETTPQVLLLDPKTNDVVKRFYRFVDADGNPNPQTDIQPGLYHLSFAGNPTYNVPVSIMANKKNKVMVTVKNTTLYFYYKEPPNTTIKEGWTATVTERNKAQGRVQEQKMTEQIQYEPGNYHIEINTFPREIRNVDLDFTFESGIPIDHPGFVKFIPTDTRTASVVLYQRLGDKFLAFYTLQLNDPRSQHLQIQPGEYQVHYQKGPGQGYAAEQVLTFMIKPNQETTIELK